RRRCRALRLPHRHGFVEPPRRPPARRPGPPRRTDPAPPRVRPRRRRRPRRTRPVLRRRTGVHPGAGDCRARLRGAPRTPARRTRDLIRNSIEPARSIIRPNHDDGPEPAPPPWHPGSYHAISRTTRQGFPAAKTPAGMSRVTTLPAPITARSPIRTPG